MKYISRIGFIGLSLFSAFACGTDQRPDTFEPNNSSSSGGMSTGGAPSEGEPLVGLAVPGVFEAEAFVRAEERGPEQEGDESCVSAVDSFVDIVAAEDASGGCAVGYATAGEWLEFDIAVEESGAFDFVLVLASELAGQSVSVAIDGVSRGSIAVPATGWEDFAPHTLSGVSIQRGSHVLRVTFDTGAVNLDTIEVVLVGACVPACDGRGCGPDFCGGECGTCDTQAMCNAVGQCVGPFVKPVQKHGQLAVEENQVVNERGEPAQLRGVSSQWLNWEMTYSTNRDNMQFMRDSWGLQVFRIANGIEESNGYLLDPVKRMQVVKTIIESAIALDVYVIVDFHTHELEHLNVAKEFFAEIAAEYGDKPHVIYEPFNEPIGPSNSGATPNAELEFWQDELKPYHEEIVSTIREYDPDNLIILGTPRWSQAVDVAANDPVTGDNLAYTLHFYSCTHQQWLRDKAQKALDAGAALFVTEWATTHADGGTSNNPGVCIGAADVWHEWLDERHIGSAAWKLTTDGDASSLLLPGASPSGGWTDAQLSEHGLYVRSLIQRQ